MMQRPMARRSVLLVLVICILTQVLVIGAPIASAAAAGSYRALIIGNNEYKTSPLKGCINDAKAIKGALATSTAPKYAKLSLQTDLTASGITRAVNGIKEWGLQDNDVTVIYYSGHGYKSGTETGLVGTDMRSYSFGDMEKSLNQLRGTVVVLIDACHSGGAIGKSISLTTDTKSSKITDYNQAVIDIFEGSRIQSKAMTSKKYHVITAASTKELSFESGGYGFFTTGLTKAMGWNASAGEPLSKMMGDKNGDNKLTISEAYSYARDAVKTLRSRGDQNVQISPTGSSLVLMSRTSASSGAAITTEPSDAPTTNKLPNPSTAILSSGQMLRLNSSQDLTWSTGNQKVATVSTGGLVTARAKGKTTIVGKKNGKTIVKCKVGVVAANKAVKQVALNKNQASISAGSKLKLKAQALPSTAMKRGIKWVSSDTSIATVDNKGVVYAKKTGSVKIYALSTSGINAVCKVEVTPAKVTKVQHKKSKVKLKQGKSLQMQARALPKQAADKTLTWSSADPSIAKVDAKTGKVTALKPGKVYITAKAADGSGKSARCLLTVLKRK
ncbi:Ig-like domain-containing protein [Eubacteriales bacterium OttesenSCG-928-N13]|nr:Ig-like domain-containing protein [Eubacteriales bacterium OttesenSCG-928-N13]